MKKARGYELASRTIIDRRKHRVYLNRWTTVGELIRALEEMPEKATFEEFEPYCDDEHYLDFHFESVVDGREV